MVQVDFIDIDDDHFTATHTLIESLKALDIGRSLHGVGVGQEFLALFPTQTGRSENGA